jgi:type II secretory ATPase GspE/PulE/Tfp pilus assembly ATPase PilB-like protein
MRHPLGTLLLQEHMLKEGDLERVGQVCREERCSFEEAVTKLGLLTPETLAVFKEHLPTLASGELLDIDPNLLERLPAEVARNLICLPVAFLGGVLTVALADPKEKETLRSIRAVTGCPVEGVPALEADLKQAIQFHYGVAQRKEGETEEQEAPAGQEGTLEAEDLGDELEEATESLLSPTQPDETADATPPAAEGPAPEAARESEPLPEGLDDAEILVEDMATPPPAVRLANKLLAQLVVREGERLEVRWKEDHPGEALLHVGGAREMLKAIPVGQAAQVIQRYRVLADMLLLSRKKPQKGKFSVKVRFAGQPLPDQRKFSITVVPIGELEGEAATIIPATAGLTTQVAEEGSEAETPRPCPACRALEILTRFRYCPICGVAVG